VFVGRDCSLYLPQSQGLPGTETAEKRSFDSDAELNTAEVDYYRDGLQDREHS
jgi:hypothetical protein